ncbi:MAG: M20/M25/M40 family metallo-hydrolase [Pseudomonadales bacterium]
MIAKMNRLLLAAVLILVSMQVGADAVERTSADYKEPYQQQALAIYRQLISYRSAAGHGKVPAVAEFLAEQFRQGGFEARDVQVLPLQLPDGEQTASLVVRYRGDGSLGKKPVLLVAHMDVVDALPEDWERDPFTLIEEDGYFFGRGTLDDKFGITTLTSNFLRMRAAGYVPGRDFVIAFTGDEETGMLTTQSLVKEHRKLTDAEFALNADGGGGQLSEAGQAMQFSVQTAEKTYASFELTVRNPGGHSSAPRKDNAIYQLGGALANIESHEFPVRVSDTTRRFFRNAAEQTEGPVGAAMAQLAANPNDAQAAAVLAEVPSLKGLTRTTCVATMLRAGHAENALPQSATATVNCRIFPGESIESIAQTLEQVSAQDGIEVVTLNDPVASPESPVREDVIAAIRAGVERIHPGTPITPYMAAYGTDGMRIRPAGIPTYGVMSVFMRPENIFAHGLNERVPVRAFFDGLEFWNAVLLHLGKYR